LTLSFHAWRRIRPAERQHTVQQTSHDRPIGIVTALPLALKVVAVIADQFQGVQSRALANPIRRQELRPFLTLHQKHSEMENFAIKYSTKATELCGRPRHGVV
jgi:hypothetical protein